MPANPTLYAYLRGEILPYDQAFLHVSDLSIQRGYGIFDFLKVENGQPLFMEHYLDRFYHSAQLMELAIPLERSALQEAVFHLIDKNNLPLSGIKMILTGGYSLDGYQPVEPNLMIVQQPVTMPTQEQLQKGFEIITHEYVRDIPAAKTINYSVGIKLLSQIKAAGADDVLYHQGCVVSEFPRANFFIVKQDDTVVTAAQDVLKGITRKNVLEIAGRTFKAEEGTITLQDIDQAKEAFLTSTTKRVMPVVKMDGYAIGDGTPGPVTLALLEELLKLEKHSAQR
ncbi:amino acid aminotransferase [Nibribacter ruber]|uniref:branched-chain-amino-acid transaminase n=1 Tax=Nibribacter ruber TaxID=2698458 RepID=A0A6P1NYI1_9BACT|nr:aminotransferase class IV [Nibribacter ruber]QHL85943.1 amino acid aminotransferase [Nibribacter ruber]